MDDADQTPIAVMGPTAVGKSAVAMALAERLGGELISVDSAQVYRGMNIGTAKPDAEQRARIPHHLIDLRDPAEPYSAAEFARDAAACVAAIQQRGARPILVGGTGLYFEALTEGLSPLPPADPAIREALEAERERIGAAAQHQQLARIDPGAAERLHPNDAQRVQRALEVHARTGRTLSEWQRQPREPTLRQPVQTLVLEPPGRAWLHQRIAERFDAMLAAGLVGETWQLFRRGDLDPGYPAIRSVGYRQVWSYLAGESTYSAMRTAGVQATRGYAKRQLTWLRARGGARIPAAPDPVAAAHEVLGVHHGAIAVHWREI